MAEENVFTSFNPYPGKGELTVLFGGHSRTHPLHKAGPQVLDYFLVHLVVSGRGLFRCRGKEYRLEPGNSFFIFPGELVTYQSDEDDPWVYRWVAFKGTQADELLDRSGISALQPVTMTRRLRRMTALYHTLGSSLQRGGVTADLQAGGYLRLLFAEYAMEQTGEGEARDESSIIQQQVEQAIRWLTLQYYQPISIEGMARTLGYHRTHLSKMFKQHTGLSPMQFLLKIRMERAMLLLQDQLTIEQVASSVGFSDPLYFSKQFRRWFGTSPTHFRSQLRDPSAAKGK